jgi:hypothetical protein
MNLRGRLTYANVVSTVALVLVIGGGGAYAAGFIDSGDIVNNSIKSRDLDNRDAVKARDVRKNGLTGKEIKEDTLDLGAPAPIAGGSDPGCNPNASNHLQCVGVTVRLAERGRVMTIATGEFVAVGGPAEIDCAIFVDAERSGPSVTPGENNAIEDSFALTRVTARLGPGQHNLSLRCRELEEDAQLATSTIAVLGISG